MTIQGNYRQLDAIQRDMAAIQKNSPALALLLSEKINNFYQKNAMRLKILNGKRFDLAKKHCLLDANEQPMLKKDENGVMVYCFIDDSHSAEFEKDMLDLYQMNFEIYA
jgi:hypothetical protein